MKLLLCGGGTAGHVNPAIAVAEELKKRDKDAEILFIGRDGGKENELITRAGFKLKTIKIEGLRRSFTTDNIRRIITALKARSAAEKIIKSFNPDVILGTGGYVCWPVISAGKALGIPTAVHESNITPGMTTKLVSGKCDLILINHEKTKDYLGSKVRCVTVGNPLRQDFGRISRGEARKKMGLSNDEIFIVSFGGSIGAKQLNEVITEVMDEHSTKIKSIRHLHASGKRYYSEAEKKYIDKTYLGCRIVPYIDNMPTVLKAADIVICRCGAVTLSEISAVGVASILIPSPNVSGNHQFKNARHLADGEAAVLIEEKNLSKETLINQLFELENDENGRKNRAKIIKAYHKADAAKLIIDELYLLRNSLKKTV